MSFFCLWLQWNLILHRGKSIIFAMNNKDQKILHLVMLLCTCSMTIIYTILSETHTGHITKPCVYSMQTLGTHTSQNTFPSDFYLTSVFIFFSLPFQWYLLYSGFKIAMLHSHLHLSPSNPPSFPIPLPCFMSLCSTHHYLTWHEVDEGHWDL